VIPVSVRHFPLSSPLELVFSNYFRSSRFFFFYFALCFDFGARVLQPPRWLWIQLPCSLHGQSFLFYLFTLGSSCLVVQRSLFIRYQRSHLSQLRRLQRLSSVNESSDDNSAFFSVQHASLVTSRRRFSASTSRFAFNLDSWDGLFYSVGLLTTRSLNRTILCSLFGIGTIERRFLHPTGYSLLFRTPPSHRSTKLRPPASNKNGWWHSELAKRLLLAFGLNLMEWKRWGSDY